MSVAADNAETLAIRASLDAFGDRLNHELGSLNGAELTALDGSKHCHTAILVTGKKTIAVLTVVCFTSDPKVVAELLAANSAGAA